MIFVREFQSIIARPPLLHILLPFTVSISTNHEKCKLEQKIKQFSKPTACQSNLNETHSHLVKTTLLWGVIQMTEVPFK